MPRFITNENGSVELDVTFDGVSDEEASAMSFLESSAYKAIWSWSGGFDQFFPGPQTIQPTEIINTSGGKCETGAAADPNNSCKGEGEITLKELIDAKNSNSDLKDIAGIIYKENNHIVKFWPILISHFDFIRYAQLKTIEDERRAYEAKMKPIWDAEKAVKKEAANRESMLSLAAAAGVKVQHTVILPD